MGKASDYWTFLRLDPSGTYRSLEKLEIKAFFQQQFPDQDDWESLTHEAIQSHLFSLLDGSIELQQAAMFSLRCFISHQIVQTCLSLVNQFGSFYRFGLTDLLPLVLDDDGRVPLSSYASLSQQILKTFKPGSGSFSHWITRLVRQHRELNHLLLEHGLYLISDWAILNDTPIDRLRRILNEFFSLAPAEIEQACHLLESYRAIYLPEHTHSRQCQPPTEDQLQRMSDRFQQQTETRIRPDTFLNYLESLAKQLRQHRITARTGRPPTQPIEDSEAQEYPTENQDESCDPATENQFLVKYRQVFESALDNALQTVVQDRIQKAKNQRSAIAFSKHCSCFTVST
ncbi:MAG: hypothetical protein HC780_26175 [Leptolyngbyaceae cyanobacterium CSU_1_3]|nr:hypothetical protein [Leptolyngbyaceae cyanobacterium CSU_1_3]